MGATFPAICSSRSCHVPFHMRYRENTPEPIAALVDQQMVLGTAIYSLAAGLLLFSIGRFGRKYWLASVGGLLVVSSAAYLLWHVLSG